MRTQPKEKILKFTTSILLILISCAAYAQEEKGAGTGEPKGTSVDKIIVKVDNYIVLRSDLENAYQGYLTNGNPANEEARCNILNSLVINKLMVAKAEIDSVVVTDAEVDNNTQQRMQVIMQNSGNSPEQLERAYGKSMAEIQSDLRDQVREQLLGREMQMKITKGITITPSEVRRFFNKIPSDSLPFYSSDVEVGQIVKVAKVSDAQKEQTRARLFELRTQLMQGANWEELARKNSEDPSAEFNGGDMSWVGRGSMVPAYEAMAFKLKKNEISIPFESPFGFHIMQLLDRRGNEYHSRHILISASPSPEDLKRAEFFLDSITTKVKEGKIKFDAAAKEFSDDQGTKQRGGYFADADGGTKVSIKELDPVVYFAIDTMKLGNISPPIVYRTDDGKDAVRILYFKTKLSPHAANLTDDWHRIQAAALAEKKDKALDRWFYKARNDVFISVDPAFSSCGILE
jgi:peptidyl-prolyl cis-trans isomerase SurA